MARCLGTNYVQCVIRVMVIKIYVYVMENLFTIKLTYVICQTCEKKKHLNLFFKCILSKAVLFLFKTLNFDIFLEHFLPKDVDYVFRKVVLLV